MGVGVRKGEKGGKFKLEVTETGVNSDFSYHLLHYWAILTMQFCVECTSLTARGRKVKLPFRSKREPECAVITVSSCVTLLFRNNICTKIRQSRSFSSCLPLGTHRNK